MELAKKDLASPQFLALVWPAVYTGVFKPHIFELRAINRCFEPFLCIVVVGSLIASGLVEGLEPLEHFYFAT